VKNKKKKMPRILSRRPGPGYRSALVWRNRCHHRTQRTCARTEGHGGSMRPRAASLGMRIAGTGNRLSCRRRRYAKMFVVAAACPQGREIPSPATRTRVPEKAVERTIRARGPRCSEGGGRYVEQHGAESRWHSPRSHQGNRERRPHAIGRGAARLDNDSHAPNLLERSGAPHLCDPLRTWTAENSGSRPLQGQRGSHTCAFQPVPRARKGERGEQNRRRLLMAHSLRSRASASCP
jgi:hypothetical protein